MTDQPKGSGADLIGDFQRWIIRSGARGVSRELGDQIKTAFGRSADAGDVWQTATTEPPSGEAPECAWCPVCRAARLLRESGPGLASQMAAAGDVLGTLLQDAVSAAEAALASAGRTAGAAGKPGQAAGGAASVTVVEVAATDPAQGSDEQEQRRRNGAPRSESLERPPHELDDRD